jgi:UV DNA damage endonuclease
MNKFGLCCISLKLKEEGYSFQTMTYKRFSSLNRDVALEILGDRILNNMFVTNKIIKYCAENGWVYRMSSDLFPLITYETANVDLIDLPNIDDIYDEFENIERTINDTGLRISLHPSEYNSLASTNTVVVDKTVAELNFYSSFMDIIGCPTNYNSPINLHIHNKQGSYSEITERFISGFNRLDPNCRNRLVIENDDKSGGWNVQELIEYFNSVTHVPITFDYLHQKCNPSYDEETAVKKCYDTWHGFKPLFHYSESKEGNNPRAHADYAKEPFETYGLDFDIDMELKAKDEAILKYQGELSYA